MLQLDSLKERFKAKRKTFEKELKEFISFQTVSADPSYLPHFDTCSKWLEAKLKSMGAVAERWNKEGHPIVFASFSSPKKDAPTLLLYNHYDVQPVDPIEEWESDPFTATVAGDNVRARGVSDDKGQFLFVLSAIEEFSELPCNIKILIEGEEETASSALIEYCEKKKKDLKADYSMVLDLGMHKKEVPSIAIGTRGVTALSLTLRGANQDLHSGTYGGFAPNPLHAIAELLTTLHKEDGSVAVPGFYDGIKMPSDEERAKLCLSMNEKRWEEEFGQPPVGGEQKFSPLERSGLRPTLEINGISGGYTGPGIKTVIPREAKAKISCRLVPGQNLAVEKAMEMVWGKRPKRSAEGGSIPIIPILQEASQSDLISWGVGLPTDRIHAPNENISFEQLERGFLTLSLAIEILGQSE